MLESLLGVETNQRHQPQDLVFGHAIAMRVNPSEEAQGGAMRMGGKPVPFGIDEEKLDGVIDRVVFRLTS